MCPRFVRHGIAYDASVLPVRPRDRLIAAVSGRTADRVPVYLQLPFRVSEVGFVPAQFAGYDEYDNWRERDPAYRRLVGRMEAEADNFYIWRPECMRSEFLLFCDRPVVRTEERLESGRVRITETVEMGAVRRSQITEAEPGTGNRWTVEHFCSSAEDAHQVLGALQRAEPDSEQPIVRNTLVGDSEAFYRQVDLLGDRGAHWVTIPSPVLPVVRLFPPDEFLMVLRTDPELVDELIETVTDRILARLTTLLQAGVGPIIRLGGEEHFTPPLAAPADFDRFVVPGDSRIVELCHAYGRFAAVHCHGRLSHALPRFVEIGFDQTDPTEVTPDGDMDIESTKAVAGDAITVTGNIQMRELYTETPAAIATRVRRLIDIAGPTRLVVGTTGTPLEPIPPKVEANYHALLDAVLEHGGASG